MAEKEKKEEKGKKTPQPGVVTPYGWVREKKEKENGEKQAK